MPKRNPPETSRLRSKETPERARSRGPGAGSLLLFWPFHLLNLVTRPLAPPLKLLARLAGYPVVAGLYGLAFLAIVYGFRAQKYDLSKIHAMPERSIIRDRLGEELGRIHGDKRSIVPLKDVSENFRKAILAREDERFYQHGAFDVIGIGRAALENIKGKRQGASTLTQQLASDVFKLKAGEKRGDIPRQIDRKLLEIAIAVRLEASLEKDEILEAYINQINWGKSIKGIGEASRIYFEKHPSELTLSQSALLAGIVRGPDAYNPFKSMEASTRERGTTLDRMVAAGVISKAEADAAKLEPIEVRPEYRREARQSYAMLAISRDLEVILEKENIELGGLDVTTTIDLRVQHKGEEALDKKLREVERYSGYPHQTRSAWNSLPEETRAAPEYLQGAAVVVENRTGAVLAVIGGRDANESPLNRAIKADRQLGSLFKPFVYLAAFDQGLRPDTAISDGPLQPGEIKGGRNWHPHNSDGKFGGMEAASTGLIRSRNTMSVRVGNYAGIPKVKEVARMAGFRTPMPESPVSFLGSWNATPWEVATAYTIFPNDGTRYRPYLISQIKDRDGNILWPPKDSNLTLSYPAAKSGSAWSVSRILNEVATRGTAAAVSRLGFDKPCGGKTGTTDDYKDAWFAGYTSTLSCAVWVGFDIPKKTIDKGYGATLALPVWVDIMKTADRLGYKAGKLNSKVNLVEMELCRLSGKRATAGCREAGTHYIDEVPADIALPGNDLCPIHPAKAMAVDESTLAPPPAAPASVPLRALPVEDLEQQEQDIPLKAIPVE
ncbi:MAG: transglycosylase domain-containing protein [Verrucomicrobiota bacterium]